MMDDFRAGVSLPGIGTWREVWARERPHVAASDACPADFIPAGAGYANLQTKVKANPDYFFNLAANRHLRDEGRGRAEAGFAPA